MGELAKARKAFVKAYVTYEGHTNWEFQCSKNRALSDKVRERNIQEVRRTANILNSECEREIEILEKRVDELKAHKSLLRPFSYFPKNFTSFIEEYFPEIETGAKKYERRYLDRKYGDN